MYVVAVFFLFSSLDVFTLAHAVPVFLFACWCSVCCVMDDEGFAFYFSGKAPSLEELDPDTKEYWRKVRKMGIRRQNQLSKLKKF
jgi:hypothetical protein